MNTTYIAFLRGINVSGQKIIKMDSLLNLLIKMGFNKVQTYIQSGNIIFQDTKRENVEVENIISKNIAETFGFEVPVLVLEFPELKEIVERNPYLKKENIDLSNLHVTFLSSFPKEELVEKLQNKQFEHDEFIIINKAIYLYIRGGYGKTKLSNNFFENKLKVTATTRNWKTTNELFKLAEKIFSD